MDPLWRASGIRGRIEARLRRLAWNTLVLPRRLLERHVRSRILPSHIRHVHGPAAVDYAADEVLVICLVRNGAQHVRDYVEHHRNLGVRHIVFADNGSTDATVAIAREYEGVTVLHTELPYRRYENVIKRYLAQRFSPGRWNLCVDIDERFDYPFSDVLSLRDFVRYLNGRAYTAVVTQMLDLFGEEITAGEETLGENGFRGAFPFYDLSDIDKTEYTWGTLPSSDIRMHWGGIRRTLFGTRNGLTKAALVHVDPGVELFFDWHHVSAGRIADVTGLLLHYPFAGAFEEKVLDAVRSRRYDPWTSNEYRKYWNRLSREPRLRVSAKSKQRLTDVNALVGEEFLVVSAAYRDWVAAKGSFPRAKLAPGE